MLVVNHAFVASLPQSAKLPKIFTYEWFQDLWADLSSYIGPLLIEDNN